MRYTAQQFRVGVVATGGVADGPMVPDLVTVPQVYRDWAHEKGNPLEVIFTTLEVVGVTTLQDCPQMPVPFHVGRCANLVGHLPYPLAGITPVEMNG